MLFKDIKINKNFDEKVTQISQTLDLKVRKITIF